jgi:O-antigen ligase
MTTAAEAVAVLPQKSDRRSRMVVVIWALLFLNVLAFYKVPLAFPIPTKVGKMVTQGAMLLALIGVLRLNPRGLMRKNSFLALYSVLAAFSVAMSIRFIGLGTDYRAFRLVTFLIILWLLTPWWTDTRLILLRSQMYVLTAILVSVGVGLVLSPHKAMTLNYGTHRLDDALWPIPATQVAHYTAELCGLTIVLWLCGMISRRHALFLIIPSLAALLLTQTRTAAFGLLAGVTVAGLSMFHIKRRVRKSVAVVIILVIAVGIPASPAVRSFLDRGQTSQQLSSLSGRAQVWPQVLSAPRPETNKIFGNGLSNGAVNHAANPTADGLPIDSGWLTTYQDQGLVGIVLEAIIFLTLIVAAVMRPRGPTRALALFLISYCLFASFTETGIGQVSPYLLDLAVAASLLMPRRAVERFPPLSRLQ